MSNLPPGSILAGIFLLFSILSGVWLTRTGRPLNVVVLTAHKLISLGTVISISVAIYWLSLARAISLAEWINILITGILLLTLFASGAVLSGGKVSRGALLVAHKSFPVLAVLCFILLFFRITIGK